MSMAEGVVRRSRLLLALGALVVVIGALVSAGTFAKLVAGGFDDPHSQSVTAAARISRELGQVAPDVVVLYSKPGSAVTSPVFESAVGTVEARLRHRPEVLHVASYLDRGDDRMVSADGRSTYLAIQLRANDDVGRRAAFDAIKPLLQAPSLRSEVAGDLAIQSQGDELTKRDVERGEAIAIPFVLLLLILIFRGVVAALMPLMLGVIAILGGLAATRAIESVTTVSTFAINSITLLGLGMGVDYALIMVKRFREELLVDGEAPAAAVRSLRTAGRTIIVSGITVTLSLASMLVFPEVFLRSMAFGGMAAVGVAMLAATTVLPAMLALLGNRINALAWRRPARVPADELNPDNGWWARIAHTVMRRPIAAILAVVAVLVALAAPTFTMTFGGFDQRVLPATASSRIAQDDVARAFPAFTNAPIEVYVPTGPVAATRLAATVADLPGATTSTLAASNGRSSLLTVGYDGSPGSSQARNLVTAIRGLTVSGGRHPQVTGPPAEIQDRLDSLAGRLPLMLTLMAAVTLVTLFLAFGSILLPLKAVVANALSVAAAFGVLVWGFQDGHLSGLLPFTVTHDLEPTTLVLVLAILFGLATDYEVFLLSRVREEWDHSHEPTDSVVRGLQKTGGLITSAAALLAVVVAGFATGQIVVSQVIGVGMFVGLALDALLVRIVLVPATMRLFGRASWWLPRPLAALHRRIAIREPRLSRARLAD